MHTVKSVHEAYIFRAVCKVPPFPRTLDLAKFIRLHKPLNHVPVLVPRSRTGCREQQCIFYFQSRPHWQFAATLCKCTVTYAAALTEKKEKCGRKFCQLKFPSVALDTRDSFELSETPVTLLESAYKGI